MQSEADSPTHRDVWRIAAPLILSNISVPLLGIVDTAVMGHLDEPSYLGAVAVGATIFSFLFLGFNFLRMGTTGVAAQAYGTGDAEEMRNTLAQAVLSALGIALLLLVVQKPLAIAAWRLIDPGEIVESQAGIYYAIRIWSAPAVLTNYALIGWFIGMQNARSPLMLMLAINLTNIVLDLLFVLGFGMKVEGVAIATVIAEFVGVALGLWLVQRELRKWPGQWQTSRILDRTRFRRLFGLNLNLFIRTVSLMFAFGFLTAQGARMGTVVLAANAVLLNFQYFMAYALDGFAHAAEALAGRAIGQRNRAAFDRALRISLHWSLIVATGFCLAYLLAGRLIVDIVTDLPDVRHTAYAYLPWLIALPVVSVWSYLYDGIYVSATRAREMRDTMLFSAFAVYLPAWYFLRFLGNHGLWLAFLLFMAARGLSMHWLYRHIEARGGFAKENGGVPGKWGHS
ncbi:MAG: MATE family efflux transporter [Gammaproteobacteria bacterium]|nr:MATE family efflux transporter [Gammaproteobacteria bacterium]